MPKPKTSPAPFDALVLGGGPAGIGTAMALRTVGVKRLAVIDKGEIGQSFRRWPKGTRLLTPSFTSNQYGSLDLNTIHPSVSPAFTLETEHPTGPQYADFLRAVVEWGKLPTLTQTKITSVTKDAQGLFVLQTAGGHALATKNLVWAGGEFSYVRVPTFKGAELGLHTGRVQDLGSLKGKHIVVIGGYESGIDSAFHLIQAGKSVTVVDPNEPWNQKGSDPSLTLSPYTLDRLKMMHASGRLKFVKAEAKGITKGKGGRFIVKTSKASLSSDSAPLLATGYGAELGPVKELFHYKNGVALVGPKDDQSTKTPGLYLAGPALRHWLGKKLLVFCFIYKYRGRFPLVAASIAGRMGATKAGVKPMLDYYRKHHMVLDDLTCCGDDCAC